MLFNSIDFAIFLPIVFFLYWFVTNHSLRLQNLLIACSSYLFYGWWDWRFLSLILFSTFLDFFVGLGLRNQEDVFKRKLLLSISIVVNLGLLGFFKYYNFFVESFASAFSFFGAEIKADTLDIILPVGISFYTFQTLSYSIDVYRKKLEPCSNPIIFSAFVSFFPQLVAGPIERATHLLPQFYEKRSFNYLNAADGMRQVLWGLVKKIVIADNCAEYANGIFNHSGELSGSTLALGALFFTFQIYGDFSGYSDIATGISKLFGFSLMQNFSFPYFSRDIAEFWRRWHISLSTWFRDYLYIPLGGSKGNLFNQIRNTFIVFLVSGFWHGANWTFVVWGLLNALYFLPLLLSKKNRSHIEIVAKGKLLPSFSELVRILTTFMLTLFAWIFFRAESVPQAFEYVFRMFMNINSYFALGIYLKYYQIILLIIAFVLIEWLGRENKHALEKVHLPLIFRWVIYLLIGVSILFFGNFNESEFIYFAF